MESFYKKVRLVFVPYLVLLVLCAAAYSFINWRFYLPHPWDRIPEAIMFITLPIALAIVVVLIWLRPRLRLLTVKAEKTSPQFTLNVLSIMAIAIPTILFQHWLLSAAGELRKVYAPSEIAKGHYAKYYSVKEFAELKKYTSMRFAITSSNKGRTLEYQQYFAMPLIDKNVFANAHFAQDTFLTYTKLFTEGNPPQVWACMKYTFRIKKKESTRKKEDAFIEICKNDFYRKDFSRITYMDRLGNNELQKGYKKTIVTEGGKHKPIILNVRFNLFEKRSDDARKWAIIGTLISIISLLLVFIIFKWDEERLQAFEHKNRIW